VQWRAAVALNSLFVMKDLKADWRRWTRIERIAAVLAVFGMGSIAPALLFLGPW